MRAVEEIKEKLDSSGITEPSKLYTPFTMFTVFFILYFNAEVLGSIFLADEWAVRLEALRAVGSRDFLDWSWIVFSVFGSAILMTAAYGLCQAVSALIWGAASRANTEMARLSNKGGYVTVKENNQLKDRINELASNEKKLYERLGSYHKWSPEDIGRLEAEVKEVAAESQHLTTTNTDLTNNLNTLNKENDGIKQKAILLSNDLDDLNDDAQVSLKVMEFYRGFISAENVIRSIKVNGAQLQDVINTVENLGLTDLFLAYDRSVESFRVKCGEASFELGKYARLFSKWELGSYEYPLLHDGTLDPELLLFQCDADKAGSKLIQRIQESLDSGGAVSGPRDMVGNKLTATES